MSDQGRQRHEGDCSFHLTGACDCKWGPVTGRMSGNPLTPIPSGMESATEVDDVLSRDQRKALAMKLAEMRRWRALSAQSAKGHVVLSSDNLADSLRRELEALTQQTCENGVHGDWWADTEFSHQCPWCALEAARADERERIERAFKNFSTDTGAQWALRVIDAALARAVSDGN